MAYYSPVARTISQKCSLLQSLKYAVRGYSIYCLFFIDAKMLLKATVYIVIIFINAKMPYFLHCMRGVPKITLASRY